MSNRRPDATPAQIQLVLHAAVTGVLNPKVAFLPQYVDPSRGTVLVQFMALGIGLASLGLAFDTTLSLLAGRARNRLIGSMGLAVWRQRVTGGVMIALGLRLAFAERR